MEILAQINKILSKASFAAGQERWSRYTIPKLLDKMKLHAVFMAPLITAPALGIEYDGERGEDCMLCEWEVCPL